MKKETFLPVFFVVLGVAFAVTAWVRLRALDASNDDVVQTASASAPTTAMEDGTTPSTGSGEYTLEPFDTTSPSARAETSAQRSAREKRYEELLRAAPPPSTKPAATQTAEAPSFLDRVVAPIASALGMRGKPQPTAPAPPLASQRQPTNNGRSTGDQSPRTSTSDEPTKPREEDDPETDLIPPQLLTADFSPSQIQDGDETTFAVMVNDNLSGVRSVSGVISSPSNSLQGFSCTREGESNRFVAKIIVPKDAPSGTWAVKYLTLSDNASNSVNLNKTQGSLPPTAEFKVSSSAPDSTGPTLKQVWLEKQAMRAGDRNTVFVQAEDDKAGVTLVSGVFVSPAKFARIGFGCSLGSNGTWECRLSPPSCLDCGIWTLEQIQLKDKADNLSTFRGDNPIVRGVALDIAGNQCDATPPQVTQLSLSPTSVTNTQASIITVTATVVDEGCGASSLSAQAIPPGGVGGQRRPVTFVPSNDGLTFTGRLEIQQFAAKGVWTISWIQALDKGLNLKAYGASDPVAASATFRVE